MIFVTVGNPTQGFRRLLDAVDALAGRGAFGTAPVFVQSGHNPGFSPRHCEATPFISTEEFERRMRGALLIISHGGSTVLSAIRLGKTPIVMPRMARYGEHVNDHQVQFVRALATDGRLIPAFEPEDLGPAVSKGLEDERRPMALPMSQMPQLVAQAIVELTRGKR